MANFYGQEYSEADLRSKFADMRQIFGSQACELSDGVEKSSRCVRLYNGAGLDLTVLLDRGMSIYDLRWKGVQLALINPVGAAHPALVEQEGTGWLRTWPGGFLTPCGLTQVGEPCVDGAEKLGQHGRAASLQAERVVHGYEPSEQGCRIQVSGTMREVAMFGHHLRWQRKIWLESDQPVLVIEDEISNQGTKPAPHMFLQHFNLGHPLISADTRVETTGSIVARDEASEQGLAESFLCSEPLNNPAEQVFYHDLKPDDRGMTTVRVSNPRFNQEAGLRVEWRFLKSQFPVFVQWKNMAEGFYVMGIEPANCHVEGRVHERERGTLRMLQPQESQNYRIEVRFS